jgi:ATP-grasp domain, R2K clade family 3
VILLVPCDPLQPRRVDDHFAAEADAARDAGWTVVLVDHDALQRPGGADPVIARVPAGGHARYRGWMLRSEQYTAFADALSRRDITLCASPAEYQRAHELPGWYPTMQSLTPPSVWTIGDGRDAFDAARVQLGAGPAVLRDYTKSMKHHWHEAAFIPDLADADASWAVAARFRQLREDEFTGGYVLRRFEAFTGPEVRTWWVDGVCQLVTAHPDTPDDPPPAELDLGPITHAVTAGRLPFVTVDLAHRVDGVWRVVELGDGQVSDRPSTTPPAQLVAALATGLY